MVQADKLNYVAVMTVTGTMVRAKEARGATVEELVTEIHNQYCISDGGNK